MSLFRRRVIATSSVVAGVLLAVAACSDSSGPDTGTLVVRLTDAPFSIDSLASVDIHVLRVDARVADADSADAAEGAGADSASRGGWRTVASPDATIDLLQYQNGASLLIGTAVIPAGDYRGFRLVIDPSRSSITLKNGVVMTNTSSPNVTFPSGATSGIKIVLTQPVVVTEGDTTAMMVDFDIGNSFVLRGNSLSQNGLLFKPVIKTK